MKGYNVISEFKNNKFFYINCFFVYCLVGWLYEVFLEVIVYKWGFSNRGVLFGPYLPVYGFGAIIFILLLQNLVRNKNIKHKVILAPVIFIGCAVIATIIELFASYLCELFLGSWPWDTYVDYDINFQGRIALSPSIRFGLGGMLFIYIVQPVLEKLLLKHGESKLKKSAIVIVSVMALDFIYQIVF